MKKLIWLIVIGSFIGCGKENQEGVVTSLRPIWATSISDAKTRPSIPTPLLPSILHGDGILLFGYQNNKCNLLMLNTQTGAELWRWQDLINGGEGIHLLEFIQKPIIEQNTLYWNNRRDNYAINLDNGKTIWKNNLNGQYFADDIYPFFQQKHLANLITSRKSKMDTLNGASLWLFDNNTGNGIELIKPSYDYSEAKSESERCGFTNSSHTFIQGSDTLVAIAYTDPYLQSATFRTLLSLYNLTKKSWIYERKLISQLSSGLYRSNYSNDGKAYFSTGNTVTCHNITDGSKLWSYSSRSSFSYSGVVINGNQLFGYDSYGIMFCLDKNTGRQIWKTDIGGFGSQIQYLNGIIYTNTGAFLKAVEAETGKKLWEIPSPDKKKANGHFDLYVGVVPGKNGQKGKIVVTTGYNAYCYEALR